MVSLFKKELHPRGINRLSFQKMITRFTYVVIINVLNFQTKDNTTEIFADPEEIIFEISFLVI